MSITASRCGTGPLPVSGRHRQTATETGRSVHRNLEKSWTAGPLRLRFDRHEGRRSPALAAVLLAVAMLPAVLLGGDGPDVDACGGVIDADHLAVILTTIRTVETGGRLRHPHQPAPPPRAPTPSSTQLAALRRARRRRRRHLPSAWMAPPADQDAAATAYVNEILADHDGRIEIIPLAWYLPSAIGNDAD